MAHTTDAFLDRRALLLSLVLTAAATPLGATGTRPRITIWKDPNCGCCGAWGEHLTRAGFPIHVVGDADMEAVKNRFSVPDGLRSCHTAEVGGYVLEGHVPAEAVARLLAESPAIRGLAVPGMPIGSPGMEVAGMPPETYAVRAFRADGAAYDFMTFTGGSPIG